jgi:preprotein translocase subunit SecY
VLTAGLAFIFGIILILVGVALDTIKQFNASIKQHKYEGLLSE